MKKILYASLLVLAACADKAPKADGPLFGEIDINAPIIPGAKLSEIFGDYRIIPLETNDSSLIGGVMYSPQRYIKHDGRFYVNSENAVLVFDNDGKFIQRLDRYGEGPGEYSYFSDYNVIPATTGTEIWVSGNSRIHRYDAATLEFKGDFPLENYGLESYYVNDSTVLIHQNQGREVAVYTVDGRKRMDFYDHNPAEIVAGGATMAFTPLGNDVVLNVAGTNDAIVYYSDGDSLGFRKMVTPQDDLITLEKARELDAQYGQPESFREARKYIALGDIRKVGDQTVMINMMPEGDNYYLKFLLSTPEGTKAYRAYPEGGDALVNDINDSQIVLSTIHMTQSPDSFLFVALPEDDNNPSLVELKSFK